MMLTAYIQAAALLAPGVCLGDLAAPGPWAPPPDWQATPACLPPRTARRLSPEIRLAIAVAEHLPLPPEAAWVFASSVGEGGTLDAILTALCTPDMLIQPTRFQNAVHNAALGQWSIAASLRGPATSIAAYDQTAGAGLLKALLQVGLERRPTGLVVFDAPIPGPLDAKRPLGQPIGAGLSLGPTPGANPLARLTARVGPPAPPTPPTGALARALVATGNPAAALVPLLERLGSPGQVTLALHGGASLTLQMDTA